MRVVPIQIIELTVFDLVSYRAKCTRCSWEGRPRERETSAVNDAKRHGAKCKGVQS